MTLKLNLPSAVTIVLGLVAGVLDFFNTHTFGFTLPWKSAITYGLIAIGVFGASPLVGAAFRNALHLTPAESTVVSIVATLIGAAVNTFSGLDSSVKGILLGVVAFLAYVGFGPMSITALYERNAAAAKTAKAAASVAAVHEHGTGAKRRATGIVARLIWAATSILAYVLRLLIKAFVRPRLAA